MIAKKHSKNLRTILLIVASAHCAAASRTRAPSVDVYEAESSAAPALRRLPEGCRLLGTSGPMDQMESERAMDDPYKKERLDVADKGGNVLLVLSRRTVTRPNTDCPSGDTSADCLRRTQGWYRLSFEQYACDAESVAALKALPPAPHSGGLTLLLGAPKRKSQPEAAPPTPPAPGTTAADLKARILEMMREKVDSEVILAYVSGQRLSRKMTAEEIIDWTHSGIPDAVIEAAASR